ncbi:MAG: glucosidase [Cytophagales bacterium]|nr:glucosidase [Cytophaga sp.]
MNTETSRLYNNNPDLSWKKWGPYVSDRQWGTVREDYSADGSAWEYFPHDMARSRAYRWGEDGIGGISDDQQQVCFAVGLWNYNDPIIKERFFGLTGNQGNHGEDVKEYYYYLDSTPTHSYMKMMYRYPHDAFPYNQLVSVNQGKTKQEEEYELIDTGIFDNNKYSEVFIEYAKPEDEDILIRIEIVNKYHEAKDLIILPTVWFRNVWDWDDGVEKPKLYSVTDHEIRLHHPSLGEYHFYTDLNPELLFCENETNTNRVFGWDNGKKFFKDGINDYIVQGKDEAVNRTRMGTKAAAVHKINVAANNNYVIHLRLSKKAIEHPFENFETLFIQRKEEANEFYKDHQSHIDSDDLKNIQRQAFAGMMWSKQFYNFNIARWLDGDPTQPKTAPGRDKGRNAKWRHMDCSEIISMPDKWEYPWFAAWDLAFHCIPIARIDPDFAKQQILLLLDEKHLHPNGQIPAYEWCFSDVNPPVHAWAILRVFQIDKKVRGDNGDLNFLEQAYHKLLLNFTWWINQKDTGNNNIFEGGFLGLDNIGIFDRSKSLPTGGHIEQADGTAWMAMYSLNMLKISLELSLYNPNYQSMACKFFEHFHYIAAALNNISEIDYSMWDDHDNFFYDILHLPNGAVQRLKINSMVGLIPLFAVETIKAEAFENLPVFRKQLEYFLNKREDLTQNVSRWNEPGVDNRRILSLLRNFRLKSVLQRMLDETEFLSDYGIRALSKIHKDHPYTYPINGDTYKIAYEPGNSESGLFGGNSNWRGPIWFPVNYMIIESLLKYHLYYGDDFKIEYPSNSGTFLNIRDVAAEIGIRMMNLFRKDANGKRAIYNGMPKLQNDDAFNEHILFFEYFNGDTGAGLGASHQTGWTGLIADMIYKFGFYEKYKNE